MEPKTPPSTPTYKFACLTCQETKVRESIPDSWDGPWKLVSVPASEIESDTSQWSQERSKPEICIVGKYGEDDYEVVIDPPYLPGLKFRQLNLDYDPTQPTKRQKDVYGTYNATRKARDQWLQHAANVIRSGHPPEVEQAYRHHARLIDLHEELARAILSHDANTAPKLAQKLVLLYVNLQRDHNSSEAHEFLESTQYELRDTFQRSLPISTPAKRLRRETQKTSLLRALLELSDGRVDCQQHEFAEEYTASDNADIFASLLGIKETRQFGDLNSKEVYNELLKSPIFSGMEIVLQDLKEWTTKMMSFLRVGFRTGYLDLPSQVLSGFGFGQVDNFHAYLTHTYHAIPKLQRSGNNELLLLTWGTMVSDRQLGVLREWASSQNGSNLYELATRGVQDSQSVEQLAVTIAALMSYRRLLPDFSDDFDQPIEGSYVADLHALLNDHSHGNSGTVWEQMAFALIRVLRSSKHQFENLVTFLETILNRQPPSLHVFDGFFDQCLRRMIEGQSCEIAILELSHFKAPELRKDDDSDWVTVTYPEEELHVQDDSPRSYNDRRSPALETESSMEQPRGNIPLKIDTTHTIEVLTATRTTEGDMTPSRSAAVSSPGKKSHPAPPPGLHADQYTLVRLSEVEDKDGKVWEIFDTEIGTTHEVPSIEELGDGSWEMVVLQSHCRALQDRLGEIFPGSNVDLNYDPVEPTASDLKFLDYDTAKKLRECWFYQRASRMIDSASSAAAACYARRLADQPRSIAAGTSFQVGMNLRATSRHCRGFETGAN